MLYNIVINQKSIIDNGWNLKATHIAVLEVIVGFSLSSKSIKMTDESGTWVWIKASLIVAQLPMFDIKERWVAELVKDLEKCGLVERNPENQKIGRTYVRVGENYEKYKSFQPIQEIDKGMQKNAEGYAEKCRGGMQKNADNNTTIYNSHKENTATTDEKKDSSSSIETSNKKFMGLYEAFDIMTGSIKKDSEQVLKKIIQLSSCGFPFEKDTGEIELLLSEPTYTDEKSWQFWYDRYFQKVNKGSKTRSEWWRTVSQAIDSARQNKFYKLTTRTQKANGTALPKSKKIYGC